MNKTWKTMRTDGIVTVSLIGDSARLVDSYRLVSSLESGGKYIVGSPQSITRMLHLQDGRRSRGATPMLINELKGMSSLELARQAVDLGAIAPLNVTSSRLHTFMAARRPTRLSVRYGVLQFIDESYHPDFSDPLGRVQLAALSITPKIILNKRDHKEYWVNWAGQAIMSDAGQDKWEPLTVCVNYDDGSIAKVVI